MPPEPGLPPLSTFLGLAGAALALAVGLLFYLRSRHPFFRVPMWRGFLYFAYGAVIAPVVVLATFWGLSRYHLDGTTAVGALLLVGPIEEAAKFAGPLLMVGLVRRWREEPFEWMFAGAASGTGFAMVENILYAALAPDAFQLLWARSLAPMHLLWSGWLGYRIGRRAPGRAGFIAAALLGLLIASFLHGLWDALCIQGYLQILFLLFGGQLLAFGWHIRKMAWLCANRSPHRPHPDVDATSASGIPSTDFRCPACSAAFETIRLQGIDFLRCNPCGRGVIGRGDLFLLVNAYAGSSGWFKIEDWYGYYWKDADPPETMPCPGCAGEARIRRFLHDDGPPIAFCSACALATGETTALLGLTDRFRSRLENGFLHG